MLTPGIIPDSIDGVHVTLAFADGSGCSSLVQARLQICRKEEWLSFSLHSFAS